MRTRFDQQLAQLHTAIIVMGSLCEEAITLAAKSLSEGNPGLAPQVNQLEEEIDQKEREIESLCLKLLMQQQPVAHDLRMISAAAKMVSDMERIGDQAADIAEISQYLVNCHLAGRQKIAEMGEAAVQMVTKSVNAFVKNDLAMTKEVARDDDIVDHLFLEIKSGLLQDLLGQTDDEAEIQAALDLLMAAKYLERIGDHAVNIAEWVEFSITGVYKN